MKLHRWEYNKWGSEWDCTLALFGSISWTEVPLLWEIGCTFRNLLLSTSTPVFSVHSVCPFMHDQGVWGPRVRDDFTFQLQTFLTFNQLLSNGQMLFSSRSQISWLNITGCYRFLYDEVVLELYLMSLCFTSYHRTPSRPPAPLRRGNCKGGSY